MFLFSLSLFSTILRQFYLSFSFFIHWQPTIVHDDNAVARIKEEKYANDEFRKDAIMKNYINPTP